MTVLGQGKVYLSSLYSLSFNIFFLFQEIHSKEKIENIYSLSICQKSRILRHDTSQTKKWISKKFQKITCKIHKHKGLI